MTCNRQLNVHFLASLLALFFVGPVFALECPDFIAEDFDDKPTCAWIRNDTMETITVSAWKIYQDSGDLNDDYWRGGQRIINPGELAVVVGLDSDGWGAFNYDTVRGRSSIKIGPHDAGRFVYMEADINGGVVWDFEYSLNGSTWVDDESELPATETRTVGGKQYKFIIEDEWNFGRAVFDVFFTISSQVTDKGNTGYLPPDTEEDPRQINVMNLNTYLLIGPSGVGTGKLDYCDRAQGIADNADRIFANVDILVMEELTSMETVCTPDALDLAAGSSLCCGEDKPFRDRTYLLNGDPLVPGDLGVENTGGVVIMSRYPDSLSSLEGGSGGYCGALCELTGGRDDIVDYEDDPNTLSEDAEIHYIFRESNGECGGLDCLADKGFLRVKFTKTFEDESQDYFIIGTHAQADAEYADERTAQFEAIERHISSLPSDVPILIVGDTNTEQSEILDMFNTLNASSDLPPLYASQQEPLPYSEDYYSNYYALDQRDSNDDKRDQYDWVLYSNHGKQPSTFEWRNLMIRDHALNGRADLSDHAAVLGEFTFYPTDQQTVQADDTIFIDGAPNQVLVPIPDGGASVRKTITTTYPATGASLTYASFRWGMSHGSDGDLEATIHYYAPGASSPTYSLGVCEANFPGFEVPCDLELSGVVNLDFAPWEPRGRWELEVRDGVSNGIGGTLEWFSLTLVIANLPGVTLDDSDGDGMANLEDRCPLDDDNLCDNGSQDAVQISSNAQVTMFASQEGRQVGLRTWPGGFTGDNYFFATQTSQDSPGYGLQIPDGAVTGIRSVLMSSSPATEYDVPVSFRMSWLDEDDDDIVDGTTIPESKLRLAKDGVAVTVECANASECSTTFNTFDYRMTTPGEFLLFVVIDSDDDGVPDDFGGVVDNCPTTSNPAQLDLDGNGLGDACQVFDASCTPDNITLSTQADIDNFSINHGSGCSEINGNLLISGAGITDLSGLAAIESIGGSLRIENNPDLTSLAGLEALERVVAQTIDYLNDNQILYEEVSLTNNPNLAACGALRTLMDDIDDGAQGPGPGPAGLPDIGGSLTVSGNNSACQFLGCSNRLLEAGEECDDGNLLSGDGCDSTCRLESACGNGAIEPGEQCDDANALLGDGCDANCLVELNDCCIESGGPGCGDPIIQECVCADDPYCCDEEWDDLCVEGVEDFQCGTCAATAPAEVSSLSSGLPLLFSDRDTLSWQAATVELSSFNLYRGNLSLASLGDYGQCLQAGLLTNLASDSETPVPNEVWSYLVTGEVGAGVEGSLGQSSNGFPRPNLAPCP